MRLLLEEDHISSPQVLPAIVYRSLRIRWTPARNCLPDQGRWTSSDLAGVAAVDPTDPQTWNGYAYVRNNPLALTDPTGMDTNYAGYEQGVCPASQANCPLNGPPVVGSPTFPGELGTAYQNYSALMNATYGGRRRQGAVVALFLPLNVGAMVRGDLPLP
ncbi:MAG: hypothetical protein JO061_04290 [Acidobacteriaceae bacterium]|nr:hypothetical protein [Acidobacteriaceae bacterium]